MFVKFSKHWHGNAPGVRKVLADGAANVLIRRGIAEEVEADEPTERKPLAKHVSKRRKTNKATA